ncbi:hypothetical protein MFIFM68171_01766 [Madurella fahalii]|uniref:Uncharacterized protein n=1 Tax=Madurella fahalii TaxID=1157608 RepID=A0ABQ0G1C3_9PEZI
MSVPDQNTNSPPYEPSITDVLVVKAMLSKALALPTELADIITDLAEYWPHTTAELPYDASTGMVARHGEEENVFLLRSAPLGLRNWRRSRITPGSTRIDRKPLKPRPAGDEFMAEDFQRLVRSPVHLLARPCRRIIFTIRSRDQGWGGLHADRGTYHGSWTWFEVGLERWCKTGPTESEAMEQQTERHQLPSLMLDDLSTVLPEVEWDQDKQEHVFNHPLLPREDTKIQCNAAATSEARTHRVVWSYDDNIDPDRDGEAADRLVEEGRGKATADGKFVRELKLGDVVTVWAKARFPGWVNYVESVKLEVYFAV